MKQYHRFLKFRPAIRQVIAFMKNFRVHERIVSIVISNLAIIWFHIRVIPKPSRAFYPCQKAVFPVAAAFMAWIISVDGREEFTGRVVKL